jgi:hypothetical protein
MGHPGFWGWEEKAVVLCTMPTLATMELSRRWGTRLCQLARRFGSCFFSQDGGGVHLQGGADGGGGAGYGYDEGGGDYYGE